MPAYLMQTVHSPQGNSSPTFAAKKCNSLKVKLAYNYNFGNGIENVHITNDIVDFKLLSSQ